MVEDTKAFQNFKKQYERQADAREIIESVVNGNVEYNKKTLSSLLRVYSNPENTFLDSKYGSEPIGKFLSNYQFKSLYDYKDVLRALKDQSYFDSGSTFYAHFNDVITGSLFNSNYVKLDWIIEHMALNGSFAEINNVVRFIFTKDDGHVIKFLNQIIDHVSGFKKDVVVYEAIMRYGMNKSIPGLADVFRHIFSMNKKVEIISIQASYPLIHDDEVKRVVGSFLYKKTNDTKYLPQEAQDIFVF